MKTRVDKIDIQVPFCHYGQMHWPDKGVTGLNWKPNFEFSDVLTITGFHHGRSATGFDLVGTNGTRYNMFARDAEDTLRLSVIDRGTVGGTWTFVKRGMNYGVKLVRPL